jgi:hypothetical protein
MKMDKTGGQNDLEKLICVMVFDVAIFVYDCPDFSLRFVVRRLYMAGIKLCPEGLQHTMTRVVGRRSSVRNNSKWKFSENRLLVPTRYLQLFK